MKLLRLDLLSRKLELLVVLAVLPALLILLYSGIEQRKKSIETAKKSVLQLTHTMAKTQNEITRSTRQILSTLSILPDIQAMNAQAASEIFRSLLEQNPNYNNIAMLDLNGEMLASAKAFSRINLADRKHFQDALQKKEFVVGEFIVARVGESIPAFPFAYPVLDKSGNPKAILVIVIKLTSFASFHDISNLPDNSFVSLTDHKGIRMFYYPAKKSTNPIGKPIHAGSWKIASEAQEPGYFIGQGSDGISRIFAFEQVRLKAGEAPYLYVWAGIPETYIVSSANATLMRNLALLLLATMISLYFAWVIGRNADGIIKKLEKALDEINALRGIIPICSYCHNIRDDEGAWNKIDAYISSHADVQFSHSICPKCMDKAREDAGLNGEKK